MEAITFYAALLIFGGLILYGILRGMLESIFKKILKGRD